MYMHIHLHTQSLPVFLAVDLVRVSKDWNFVYGFLISIKFYKDVWGCFRFNGIPLKAFTFTNALGATFSEFSLRSAGGTLTSSIIFTNFSSPKP